MIIDYTRNVLPHLLVDPLTCHTLNINAMQHVRNKLTDSKVGVPPIPRNDYVPGGLNSATVLRSATASLRRQILQMSLLSLSELPVRSEKVEIRTTIKSATALQTFIYVVSSAIPVFGCGDAMFEPDLPLSPHRERPSGWLVYK